MPIFRLVAAFLIAPWVPVVAYYGVFSLFSFSADISVPNAAPFFVGLIPVAYLATALGWLPFVFILRRFNKDRFVPLAAGGTVLGVIVGTVGLAVRGVAIVDPAAANFLIIAAVLGLSFGMAFWAIALARKGPEHKAESVL